MRKIIASLQVSVDGFIEGPTANRVDKSFAENHNNMQSIILNVWLMVFKVGPSALIQSDFKSLNNTDKKNHGNFEAVVLDGNALVHYWYDNEQVILGRGRPGDGRGWNRALTITSAATSTGCIIQSEYMIPDSSGAKHGTFEVVVCEGNNLAWYRLYGNRDAWERVPQSITSIAAGPASMIQSDFTSGRQPDPNTGDPGDLQCNFELVALESDSNLVHYYYEWDPALRRRIWIRNGIVTSNATGPASIIQSDYMSGRQPDPNTGDPGDIHGDFEVIVPEGQNLAHYKHTWDYSQNSWIWKRADPPFVITKATGPACIIQSCYKARQNHGNFEAAVLEDYKLIHYWHDNSNTQSQWNRAQIITHSHPGPASIIQSDFVATGQADAGFDVLVQECLQSVVYYWLSKPGVPWGKGYVPILSEPYIHSESYPRRVAQLTGNVDRTTGLPTLNRTNNKQYKVFGTDLGSSFLYQNKLYFLFGDTRTCPTSCPGNDKDGLATDCPSPTPENPNRRIVDLYDTVAYTTDMRPDEQTGIRLEFIGRPVVNDIGQKGSEVPVEGLGRGNNMYVFFATNSDSGFYFSIRSVLGKSTNGGLDFGNSLYTFSKIDAANRIDGKFINISAEVIRNDNFKGLLPDDVARSGEEGLMIWGSGRFEASDLYLAYMPLKDIEGQQGQKPSSVAYFSGYTTVGPKWSADEENAVPLLCAGCIREFSVRWNFYINRWILMYNSNNPRGIVMCMAESPWGEWSSPVVIFDPRRQEDMGYGYFLHSTIDHDSLSDCFREDSPGGEYAPYQIGPYSVGVKNKCTKVYFTMSTWNPYQVVLMSAIVCPDGLVLDQKSYAYDASAPNDRKYANLSVLMAQLARDNGIELKLVSPLLSSLVSLDHMEWAQFHSHIELRNELKSKFQQIISLLSIPEDKANAYAKIAVAIGILDGSASTNNTSDFDFHTKWAVDIVRKGNDSPILNEMNTMIDSKYFLPDHDDWCYAYDADAPNDRKYARIRLQMDKLAQHYSTQKVVGELDSSEHEKLKADSYFGNAYVASARFQTIENLRHILKDKMYQMMIDKNLSSDNKAKVYVEITTSMIALGVRMPEDKDSVDSQREVVLTALERNDLGSIMNRMNKRIDSEHFLVSTPSKSA